MTEQTVQDLVQRIAQVEEHMNTAGEAIREVGLRAQPAENRAIAAQTAARARQDTAPTALVDARLLEKPRTFSGAFPDWIPLRFTVTAYAGALGPDMKRLTERAVEHR